MAYDLLCDSVSCLRCFEDIHSNYKKDNPLYNGRVEYQAQG